MRCHCQDHVQACPKPARRRGGGIIGFILQAAFLYVLMVFGGGTLINTGHPVAMEVGRIMQIVTFVEPTIYWTQGEGYEQVSDGLRVLANGLPVDQWVS